VPGRITNKGEPQRGGFFINQAMLHHGHAERAKRHDRPVKGLEREHITPSVSTTWADDVEVTMVTVTEP
jgi:hypothetical protein